MNTGLGQAARRPNAYGANPTGTFFNRVQTYRRYLPGTDTIRFPKSCRMRGTPCVPVCRPARATSARRRHRPRRLRQVHRLQVLRLGLPVRCARDRRSAPGDDQVRLCVDRIHDEQLLQEDQAAW
jgi:hypothetical protein